MVNLLRRLKIRFGGVTWRWSPEIQLTAASGRCWLRLLALPTLLALAACSPTDSLPGGAMPSGNGWQEFQGVWTAAGSRHTIHLGPENTGSISKLEGSLFLEGASRPGQGFRMEVIALTDSRAGMTGLAVWTDEHGNQLYSELKGEGTATGNRVNGTFTGGSKRYAGASGTYEFSWRFILMAEEGVVQGQSQGFKGRVQVGVVTPEGGRP